MGSLTQKYYNFCISPKISSKFFVYTDYIISIGYYNLYIVKTNVLLQKQTSCHLWKGDFDCINLTVKFQYWSCGNAQQNQKNPVAVMKELRPLLLFSSFFLNAGSELSLRLSNAHQTRRTTLLSSWVDSWKCVCVCVCVCVFVVYFFIPFWFL